MSGMLLFPLPKGAGQGEGDRGLLEFHAPKCSA
jgi:hypothetical protein